MINIYEVEIPNCTCNNKLPYSAHSYILQVSPAQPTGGRRRRATEMDPDERRQRFLERNRAAASRCRQKRKLWVNGLEKKAEDLANMNVSLTVSRLQGVRQPFKPACSLASQTSCHIFRVYHRSVFFPETNSMLLVINIHLLPSL